MDLSEKSYQVFVTEGREDRGRYYEVTEIDKWGPRYSGPYQGKVLATYCAKITCDHPRHGSKCMLCEGKWAEHESRAWPGQLGT